MMNPFHSSIERRQRNSDAVCDDDDFEGKVRSGRGAKRAITKAQQAISTGKFISCFHGYVNFWFWKMRSQLFVAVVEDAIRPNTHVMNMLMEG
jgi:hypothetical protein